MNPANNFGDWATNVYAPEGTPITLQVRSDDGPVTFRWVSSTASCDGNSSKIEVFVNGADVGWIFFAHFQGGRGKNVSDPQPTNGMTIGTMHYFPTGDCNPGPHLHVEMSDNHSGALKYSCWIDNGQPGVTLQQGDPLGMLGSLNQEPKEPCTGTRTPAAAPAAAPGPRLRLPRGLRLGVDDALLPDGHQPRTHRRERQEGRGEERRRRRTGW